MASPAHVSISSSIVVVIDGRFRSPVAIAAVAALNIFTALQAHCFNFITTAWLHPFIESFLSLVRSMNNLWLCGVIASQISTIIEKKNGI